MQVPDTATVLQSRAQLNEMPDMFGCTTGNMFELMFEDGIIMDLTGQKFLSSVEPSSLEMSTYNGKNWRLPYSLSCYGLYVRTDIFEEQGLALPTDVYKRQRQKITPTAESGYSCMMARAQYSEDSGRDRPGNRPRASSAVKIRAAPFLASAS